jgi:hypothetical protein
MIPVGQAWAVKNLVLQGQMGDDLFEGFCSNLHRLNCRVVQGGQEMAGVQADYKSPVRKIIAFLEKSRDGWKAKHHAVKQELRRTENQLRAVTASREKWRRQAEEAQAELNLQKKVFPAK